MTAAQRELLEELGVEVKVGRRLGVKEFSEDDYTMEYTWYSAEVMGGTPRVMEPEVHDECRYFAPEELAGRRAELSANTLNFLEELQAGRVQLAT